MEPGCRCRALPQHSGWTPSTRSLATSLSGVALTDNPCMQCCQEEPKADAYRSPVVVRRNTSRSALTQEWIRRLPGKDAATFLPCANEHNLHHLGAEVPGAAGGSTSSARELTTMTNLQQLLRVERAMRLAAERRTVEEMEHGVRAAITVEANYGSRLLYSILLEAIASTSPASTDTSPWGGHRSETQSQFPAAASCSRSVPLVLSASASVADTASYRKLLEENRQLREEVRRYKSIDIEDRYEVNELHRNMQAVIDRLTLERDRLHAELAERQWWPDATLTGSSEPGRISPKTTTEQSSWHYTHIVDATAVNSEESPEHACRPRVLPLP
ncbi:hypothetical protein TraAM80_08717 [Trypanosoma rangeli]|uniref:Uncharacterized protein n=1 Tax=Trypanosoma rangeli TaxID=5698 RepID=A0A3R7JXQ0_TRYRA|nr:uncharacterized protein TraAM80_08717 [Trypanosoma rangeli]RNE98520.1 hypothetical protein TraAM80_08717 [Trypanosoma rangeli]|eukprot:RNE98520.1 hypothetical protein TraAM80_08717 [Trypanosoma rangeli]